MPIGTAVHEFGGDEELKICYKLVCKDGNASQGTGDTGVWGENRRNLTSPSSERRGDFQAGRVPLGQVRRGSGWGPCRYPRGSVWLTTLSGLCR